MAKIEFVIAFLFISLIGIVSSFQTSFAAEGYFKPSTKELFMQPTICIFQPYDPRVDENRWDSWYNDAKAVIDEWEIVLKQRTTSNITKWNIEVIEIPSDKKYLYNPAGCNIEVHYTDSPLEDNPWALGWYWTGTGVIEMLYITADYCGKEYSPQYGFYLNYYCFNDTLERPKKIAAVLKHELGHAFGIHHYVTDDQELLEYWYNNPLGQPSIMTFAHHNEEQMKIQQIDVERVMEIYGIIGFGREKNENLVFEIEEIVEPELIFESSSYVQKVEVEKDKLTFHKISGFVPDYLYKRGIPVEFYIQKPDSTLEISQVMVTKDKYFEYPLMYDYNSVRGEYKVIIKYSETEITKSSFYVDLKSQSSSDSLILDNNERAQVYISREKFAENLDDLKLNVKEIENSLTGLVYENSEAQAKIDHAWALRWTLLENINEAEIKFSAGEYELGKGDLKTAMEMFDTIPSNIQNVEKLSEMIYLDVLEAKKIGGKIPSWIKDNAKWWSERQIRDSDFVNGIQYMIKENIMVIPDLPENTQMELKDEKRAMGLERDVNVPDWIRNNAGWWADGLIGEDDFVNGIKYLVENGIIRV